MRFFFFGSLQDHDVLETVIGRRVDPDVVTPARLSGFRRVRVAGQCYPMLLAEAGAQVEGMVVASLDACAAGRICLFEGAGYHLARTTVETAGGRQRPAYWFSAATLEPVPVAWDLARWQAEEKAPFLAAIRGWAARLEAGAIGLPEDEWQRRLAAIGGPAPSGPTFESERAWTTMTMSS